MKWTRESRNGNDRFVFKTEHYTAAVWYISDKWLWTVHRRGKADRWRRPRLLAHGKCKDLFDAQQAAQSTMACECAEAGSRNCTTHQMWDSVQINTPLVYKPCIYFCGADSSGKSELVKYVAKHYKVNKVPEQARAVLHEEGLSLAILRAKSADADSYQRLVFERQLQVETQTSRPFVADRGLDNLAYASENARCFAELIKRPEIKAYIERQRQDIVFLVRPQKDLRAEDGVRLLPSWDGQQRIDAKIELLLQLWRIEPVVIAESSSARREELIDYVLSAKGFKKHG